MELWHELFDIFVLPSHREGFPRAAMEASAMATPVVATDIRGCRQVVDDGRTGLLVPVRDSQALADALEGLIWNREHRTKLGEAARRRAKTDFDQARVIARTASVYRSLLDARGIPVPESPTTERYIDSIDLVETAASKPAAATPAA